MKNRFRNTDKKYAEIKYNIEQSRNASREKLKIEDQHKMLYSEKGVFETHIK